MAGSVGYLVIGACLGSRRPAMGEKVKISVSKQADCTREDEVRV